jgi:hypothetical protein
MKVDPRDAAQHLGGERHAPDEAHAAPEPNLAAIRAQLEWLAQPARGEYDDALIEIAYGPPERGPATAQLFGLDEIGGAVEFAASQNAKGANIYFGSALRLPDSARDKRCRAENYYVATSIAVDIDTDYDATRARLLGVVEPGLAVMTGSVPERRAQLWLRLTAPCDNATEYSKALDALVGHVGSDSGAKGAARVMRLGGTVSHPSPAKAARGYVTELTTVEIDPDAQPVAIERLMELRPPKHGSAESRHRRAPPDGPAASRGEEVLRSECDAVAAAEVGTRNDRLNKAAFAIGQLVDSGRLEEGRARDQLLAAAEACGLTREDGEEAVHRTIRSGLEAGKKKPRKPPLQVWLADPAKTVAALRDMLATSECLYERGGPVTVAHDPISGGAVVHQLGPDELVRMAHEVCQPYEAKVKADGTEERRDTQFPRNMAVMYQKWHGERGLPPLNGVTSAPMLGEDGSIRSVEGYDKPSGMWCERVPDLSGRVPDRPTEKEARAALRRIRETFSTFCFADAPMMVDETTGIAAVDIDQPPGADESGFLNALMTAVCRPSLSLAPGVLVRAASTSGSGAGKGLLSRSISVVAFGREPHAVTGGYDAEELEKRIAAELVSGGPVVFLDNLNDTLFRSSLLASAITERPARVRLLGSSQMHDINSAAFIVLNGNGLRVSEDLARRFISVELDPRTENPEARPFANDIMQVVRDQRIELLVAVLTIWRWGRQNIYLTSGGALGSFEQWCRWVRDPLLALGCEDPAEKVAEAKDNDVRRQGVGDIFMTWWQCHQSKPVRSDDIHEDVRKILDPQNRGRQFQTARLMKLVGTRIAGFVLTRQAPAGKWGSATYALMRTGDDEPPARLILPEREPFGPPPGVGLE